MTKISNFALKIKGDGREGGTCEVLRPLKFETCTRSMVEKNYLPPGNHDPPPGEK